MLVGRARTAPTVTMRTSARAASPQFQGPYRGDGADEEGAAGAAEFAADLGGPYVLSKAFGWCCSGEVGECDRGGEPGSGADQHSGDQDADDARDDDAGEQANGGRADSDGHAGSVAQLAGVRAPPGPRLDEHSGDGEQ